MTDDRLLVEYLRRSYHAVDGLWFIKVEGALGFDEALDMDVRVWEVLAKIQARKARSLLQTQGNSLSEFVRCFTLKLQADGYTYEHALSEEEVNFTILDCPWLEILKRSSRDGLAAAISEVMCPTEGEAWCREFGDEYAFALSQRACRGDACCRMTFARVGP